jgi:hypothetical protein
MFFTLYFANDTYYVITDSPKNTIEWILTAYGQRIITIKTDNKKHGIKAVALVALIHWLEHNQEITTNTYIHKSTK